ncbi:MAG: sulfite exporter TauE/SafE family protein [Aquificaceae bacterium]|nr:sulfite exporter TauE/SafE family protein [Aquificaceae bacterium]
MIPFLVVLFAWFFQSITGFGAGIFIIGILSLLYDPKVVVVSSALFNLVGTLLLLYQNRNGKVDRYLLFSLVVGSVPGIFLGAQVLHHVDSESLRLVIGTLIVLLGLYDLLVSKKRLELYFGRHWGMPIGFVGGFFAGLVGMGGPPPLVFLRQHLSDPCSIRLMLNLYFTSNIILRLTFYHQLQVVNLQWDFVLSGFLGLLLGVLLGSLLDRKLPEEFYRKSIPYWVMLLGFVLILLTEV